MSEAIVFLSAPLAICLILVAIHCYLGLHVLARGVIFIDLSLAQVASLGTMAALVVGLEHNSAGAYFLSLTATLVAAALFAYARKVEQKIPQEALIGIVYALAAAAGILLVDQLAHGAEHIKEVMVGQVLWVGWSDVFRTAVIYAVIGVIHVVFRKQLIQSSFGDHSNNLFWDFVFYALFGVVITSSVKVAGVLLVFSFLIVPAVLAQLFFSSIGRRLVFGWVFGSIMAAVGLFLSFTSDLPAGATVVVIFTVTPILLVIARSMLSVQKVQSD